MEFIAVTSLLPSVSYPLFRDMKESAARTRKLGQAIGRLRKKTGRTGIRLVFMGTSGAMMAALIGDRLTCPVEYIQIKKKGEACHRQDMERHGDPGGAFPLTVFVDDMIASGRTLRQVVAEFPGKIEVVAVTGYVTTSTVSREAPDALFCIAGED